MIKLREATVLKYKSIETPQTFTVDNDVTVLVGMNESGKTSLLEALAKTNYFEDDEDFKFSLTHDYPRKEKKSVEKQGEDPTAITCKYEIDDKLLKIIESDIGKGVFTQNLFSRSTSYENKSTLNDFKAADFKAFIKFKTKELEIGSDINFDTLKTKDSITQFNSLVASQTDGEVKSKLEKLRPYFENTFKWDDPIGEYTYRKHIKPNLPKFLYYDEFYALPSRISINKIKSGTIKGEEGKTGKALFELADINIDELLSASDFEDFKAELEATEAIISDELFKYWKTNRNLRIEFEIDKIVNDQRIIEHILDIRVRNDRARVSLPLKNRSKGFNWFFSFLVWFKKIQEDKNSTYILLLDEPGLNLHASAQADLLEFIEDLSKDYQILYTTHSPFMIDATKLPRIRTVVETKEGSKVSDSIQEKDPNTLFPLQAALGYNIAQNLFISKNNLIVEGASDLIYLQVISSLLEAAGREGLKEEITIVPVGGLDKVTTFISLLRSNNLNLVCLLDTFKDAKGKAKLEDLIQQKIISEKKIKFFHDYLTGYTTADIEDMFTKEDYLKLYNEAFPTKKVEQKALNSSIKPTVIQITDYLKAEFNHYRPANVFAKKILSITDLDPVTADNFEKMFKDINKLY